MMYVIILGIDCASELFIRKDTEGVMCFAKAASAAHTQCPMAGSRAPSLAPAPAARPDPAGRIHGAEQGVQTV